MLGPLGIVATGQRRLLAIPLISSKRPAGNRKRLYSGWSLDSISSLVTTSEGIVTAIDCRQTCANFT